tara:strand:+ start:1329 stop:2219 length:891 start_codon:yes stop_codon:yes gene_type:complete
MKILVSVIVNYHNGEKYLEDCIKSIVNQDYKDIEIILWDNASTDNSKKIVEKFNNTKIKYFRNPIKENLYKARNKAIKESSGDLIAFLDCDDWWEKNYLSSREKFFNNSKIDFFYSNTNVFFERKKRNKLYRKFKLPSGNIFSSLSKDYFIIISGTIFRRGIFLKFGNFNEGYNIIGDYDFIMKISKDCNAHAIDLPLLNYRVHQNNFLKNHTKLYYEEYKDWYEREKKQNDEFFQKYNNFFKNKLEYIENIFLIENQNKSIFLFSKILNHKVFFEKIKLLILFCLPKSLFKFLRK